MANKKAKNNKKKETQKKAQRRQAQFDRCHSQEAFEREHAKREKATRSKSSRLYIACVNHPCPMPSGFGYMSMLSHYEFTADQLMKISKGKPVDLSKCYQEGSVNLPEYYKTDYDAIFAAVNSFCQNPHEDTMATFLDADPRKSDREIEDEWKQGIKSSGDLIECVNHAKATPERASGALDYALYMGCPMVEIDLPSHLLSELGRG